MRISDWSSDVCSSDLGALKVRGRHAGHRKCHDACVEDLVGQRIALLQAGVAADLVRHGFVDEAASVQVDGNAALEDGVDEQALFGAGVGMHAEGAAHVRSEEHTSELQSLMRISYDVFCLNK